MRVSCILLKTLLGLFFLQGCNVLPKTNNIAGAYNYEWYDTQHKLSLNKDSTYIFFVKEGLFSDTIKGEWKIKGKQLFLIEKNTNSFHKTINCDTCSQNYLTVHDIQNKENLIAYYKAYINDILIGEGLIESIKEFPINTDSLFIESLGYNSMGFSIEGRILKIDAFLSKTESNLLRNRFYIRKDKIKSSNGLILEKQ